MLLQDLFEKKDKPEPKHKKKSFPGVFSSGSAEHIAGWLKKEHPGNSKGAMAVFNDFLNSASLTDERRAELEAVPSLLRSKPVAKDKKD